MNEIDAGGWDALETQDNPFLQYAFLADLEQTGCVGADTGWIPQHLLLYSDKRCSRLVAAAPMYLKFHSYGEYVFDWAWAAAYERAGIAYYPKLLLAIPFTPVSGPRLLVAPDAPAATRAELANAVFNHALSVDVSSLHCLFANDADCRVFGQHGLIRRSGNQFHWRNRNFADFDEFLATMSSAKRKNIRRERRRIAEAGLRCEVVTGDRLNTAHMEMMHRFYRSTVSKHGAIAYLDRSFFVQLGEKMRERVVLFLFHDADGECIAGSLNLRDSDALYGRYWGSIRDLDGLHFEACYYRPIEYCIATGMSRFEAGAQGEHKLSRGLLPSPTYSMHWLRDPRFAAAVADFVVREERQLDHYTAVLSRHSPFRADPAR